MRLTCRISRRRVIGLRSEYGVTPRRRASGFFNWGISPGETTGQQSLLGYPSNDGFLYEGDLQGRLLQGAQDCALGLSLYHFTAKLARPRLPW